MQIRFPEKTDLQPEAIQSLCDLINLVYREAEDGLLMPESKRIFTNDLRLLLENKELLVAIDNGKIIGCVKITLIDDDHAMFGMLVTCQEYRGSGIGGKLVAAAEQWARDQNRRVMCLELLTPTNWQQAHKEFLKAWYTRLGYRIHSSKTFEKTHHQITECDFCLYVKAL